MKNVNVNKLNNITHMVYLTPNRKPLEERMFEDAPFKTYKEVTIFVCDSSNMLTKLLGTKDSTARQFRKHQSKIEGLLNVNIF